MKSFALHLNLSLLAAFLLIISACSVQEKKIITVALGDSENDIPMLKIVDFPFLVRKHDGTAIETGIEKIVITEAIGPMGFTEAIERVFC